MHIDQRFRTIFETLLSAGASGQAKVFAALADEQHLLPLLTSLVRGRPIASCEEAAVQRVLVLVATGQRCEPCSDRKASIDFADMARACRDLDRGRLGPHERAFVVDMCRRGFGFRPSPRQAEWLTSIFDRLQGRVAA